MFPKSSKPETVCHRTESNINAPGLMKSPRGKSRRLMGNEKPRRNGWQASRAKQ